jgi:hypothetical protein
MVLGVFRHGVPRDVDDIGAIENVQHDEALKFELDVAMHYFERRSACKLVIRYRFCAAMA